MQIPLSRSLVLIFVLFITCCSVLSAQEIFEREFRIIKSQFPARSLSLIHQHVQEIKRLKFYQEIDSSIPVYLAKFKKDKLWYGVQFQENGDLELIQIKIKRMDIPNDSYSQIDSYLDNMFSKYKIKSIQQQYHSNNEALDVTFKNAFQNLLLPTVHYKFIVAGKKNKRHDQYELLFDADGNLRQERIALPQNYDHVLY
ncbi:hypothetical protein SAMN04488009_2438 [Maribacter sedimenticola]|uniref:Beta-lactamase-inhibitor-like, PepSY-like n=1 Tax=Maribacter sedimenticola TaxID=228956 RepID=A0ABY1SIA9_9FLAO|nr:hypothetical protein SAMN04488009_2438 [Maribacter sedimenticola]